MAFIRKDFRPVGGNSRRGKAPQVFIYTTPDTLAVAKADGYFNELLGQLSLNDWIYIATENALGTPVQSIIFVKNDGFGSGAVGVQQTEQGEGYSLGIESIVFTDGQIIRPTLLNILTVGTEGEILTFEVAEPGLFGDPLPKNLTNLVLTGAFGPDATYNLTIGNLGIRMQAQDINAA